jgi:hypothetical protein
MRFGSLSMRFTSFAGLFAILRMNLNAFLFRI